MAEKNKKLFGLLILVLAALLLHLTSGAWRAYGVPVVLVVLVVLLVAGMRSKRQVPATGEPLLATGDTPLSKLLEKNVEDRQGGIGGAVLGTAYGYGQRLEIEKAIDNALDDYITVIRAFLDTFTVAVFFPTDDGGFRIRRWFSSCDFINREAVIYPGVGVIGSFLKDGLKQLNLQEIVTDSMTLYYYSKDAGIRSLMASPIVVDGSERGTVIVDSTEKKHFSDEDHAFLTKVATLIGQTVFYAYSYNMHRLKHDRLVAMSSIEKDFFTNLDMESILDLMMEIVPYAIPCDRLTISLKAEDGTTAVIKRVWGSSAPGFEKISFSLKERSLMALLYHKNLCFFRNFSPHHYEFRYRENEPQNRDFASFLAFPFGVDECKGALLLESMRPDAFTEAHRGLLGRLATSAGLAIEKLRTLEQARAMATHDGLTGLINHRQFQQLLHDQISRAIRYKEPLSLVLGDIDFFKKLNDNYGHPFGDLVLKGVAETLATSVRADIDIAARYGGEEFALILVKTDQAQALETTDRIRQTIAQNKFRDGHGQDVGVTMSFGIAVFGEHAKDQDSLLKRSDKALYRAKENGRNRVEVF